MDDLIPPDVRRFLLAGSVSVPHIEAILLLRREKKRWTAQELASRLYLPDSRATQLLADLLELGVVDHDDGSAQYRYRPRTDELALLLDRLDVAYSKYLVEITRLVHAARDQAAEQFAQAFRIRKDT